MSAWRKAALAAVLAFANACKHDPTAMMVIVDLDPGLRDMLQGRMIVLDVAVTYHGNSTPRIRQAAVTTWPATISIEAQSASDEVLVEVQLPLGGMMGAAREVIVGRAIATFATDKVLAVPVNLWGMCHVDPSMMPAMADCRYPKLLAQPALVQAAINRGPASVRQLMGDISLLQTCFGDGRCDTAVAPTLEYQASLAMPCPGGARRLNVCQNTPDGGPMPTDAATDAPMPAEDRPMPPADAPAPGDGGALPDVVLPVDVL